MGIKKKIIKKKIIKKKIIKKKIIKETTKEAIDRMKVELFGDTFEAPF